MGWKVGIVMDLDINDKINIISFNKVLSFLFFLNKFLKEVCGYIVVDY